MSVELNCRGRKIEVIGHVMSSKMSKTIAVVTYRMVRHKKYGKFVKKTTVMKAHDEKNIARVGDKVKIYETRPLSKTKRWVLAEVLESAKV
jgi:small subunit ribosomal protein S17